MAGSKLEGNRHISDMELWDEDYFNMEVQAYIDVDECGNGNSSNNEGVDFDEEALLGGLFDNSEIAA